MAAHTPGPWTLNGCSNGGAILRRGEALGERTHIQSHLQILPVEDAQLIAAAPDLLAAARAALNDRMYKEWPQVADLLIAAIAKAEGR